MVQGIIIKDRSNVDADGRRLYFVPVRLDVWDAIEKSVQADDLTGSLEATANWCNGQLG